MAAWKKLERLLRASLTIEPVTPKALRCAGRVSCIGGCRLSGGWRFEGDVARCKKHAEQAREAYVSKLLSENVEAITGKRPDWYYGDRVALETTQAIAAKLGLDLGQEEATA